MPEQQNESLAKSLHEKWRREQQRYQNAIKPVPTWGDLGYRSRQPWFKLAEAMAELIRVACEKGPTIAVEGFNTAIEAGQERQKRFEEVERKCKESEDATRIDWSKMNERFDI